MRDSTIFYRSFYEAIKELSPELQAQVYSAIFEYALNFKEVELTGLAKTVFTLVKPQLDANLKRYASGTIPKQKRNESETEAKVKRNESETEAKVKRNKSETEAKRKRTRSKTEANDNVNDNVNHNQNENDNHNLNENVNAKRFRQPQPMEIYEYMNELNQAAGNRWNESKVRIEVQNFYDFYESKGWMIGKDKMKDWKATVRRWMNNNKTTNTNEQRIAEHIAKHRDNKHYFDIFAKKD